MIAGFGIMLTYHNLVIRYTVIAIVVLTVLLMKKGILSVLKMLLNIKNH